MTTENKMNYNRFKNRRRMAWLSFGFILIVGGWLLFQGMKSDEEAQRVEDLSFLVGTLFGVCTTIVITYFGGATVTDVSDNNIRTNIGVVRAGFNPQAPYVGNAVYNTSTDPILCPACGQWASATTPAPPHSRDDTTKNTEGTLL